MNDPRMTRHRVWIAFNQNSIFCDLFRLFPKQNLLQQHSRQWWIQCLNHNQNRQNYGKWTWRRQGWCQGSRATSGFKWLQACSCHGVLNWSHSKPFESKKFQEAQCMRKCTQKCRLSIERPGVPVTCCDAAWLCGRLPVFVPLLKSLALWVWPGHNQRNRDFCKDLSAPDSWFQTILLPVQNSDHGNAILRDLRVTSPTSCHGEWTWALQSFGTSRVYSSRRRGLSIWVERCHNFDIFSQFQESLRFYTIVFVWCFFMMFSWCFHFHVAFWVEMRHNETHAIRWICNHEIQQPAFQSDLLWCLGHDVILMSRIL